jgi:hypothetical protein
MIPHQVGNHLVDTNPAVSEPYYVVETAARTCQIE